MGLGRKRSTLKQRIAIAEFLKTVLTQRAGSSTLWHYAPGYDDAVVSKQISSQFEDDVSGDQVAWVRKQMFGPLTTPMTNKPVAPVASDDPLELRVASLEERMARLEEMWK